MKDEDINPCPVCGKAAVHHVDVQRYNPSDWVRYVGCSNADCIQGPTCKESDDAILVWNRLSRAMRVLHITEHITAHDGLTAMHRYGEWRVLKDGREGRGRTLADALIALGGQDGTH